MRRYYARLGEKDRRHYAALEAIKLGHGGATYISRLLSVDRSTIIKGKKELPAHSPAGSIPKGRQRRPGGGRKKRQTSRILKHCSQPLLKRIRGQPNG